MHKLSQVHFTSWTPEGIQFTFSRRRALSLSTLSSTTTWVTPGHSELSVRPPFCWICLWKIWHLAFPIPAGRRYTVTPLKVFPEAENVKTIPVNKYFAFWHSIHFFLNVMQPYLYFFYVVLHLKNNNKKITLSVMWTHACKHCNHLWHHSHLLSSSVGVHPSPVALLPFWL